VKLFSLRAFRFVSFQVFEKKLRVVDWSTWCREHVISRARVGVVLVCIEKTLLWNKRQREPKNSSIEHRAWKFVTWSPGTGRATWSSTRPITWYPRDGSTYHVQVKNHVTSSMTAAIELWYYFGRPASIPWYISSNQFPSMQVFGINSTTSQTWQSSK